MGNHTLEEVASSVGIIEVDLMLLTLHLNHIIMTLLLSIPTNDIDTSLPVTPFLIAFYLLDPDSYY